MTVGQWFIQLHHHLHWWGPGVLALFTAIGPWIMWYPWRHYEVVKYGSGDQYEFFSIYTQIFFVALPSYYALWFALPHKGTEILLLIVAAPFVGIYLLFFVGAWCMLAWDILLDSGSDYENRKRLGMSLAEWEIYKYTQARNAREAETKAFEEREAMFRGEDVRKERFRVLNGSGKGRG